MNCEKKLECCTALKTEGLKIAIAKHGFDALLLGIRRDEHGIRAKERFFSPRDNFRWDYKNQPPEFWNFFELVQKTSFHTRVHPLLNWTEKDIWEYIKKENIPVSSLYFAKNGKRFRSIGCEPCTRAVEDSRDIRAGRWWWETPEQKECGLHLKDGKLQPNTQPS